MHETRREQGVNEAIEVFISSTRESSFFLKVCPFVLPFLNALESNLKIYDSVEERNIYGFISNAVSRSLLVIFTRFIDDFATRTKF